MEAGHLASMTGPRRSIFGAMRLEIEDGRSGSGSGRQPSAEIRGAAAEALKRDDITYDDAVSNGQEAEYERH